MAKQQAVTLTKVKDCKHVKRYDNPDGDKSKVFQSVYLLNEAAEAIGNPNKIRVTVEAVIS